MTTAVDLGRKATKQTNKSISRRQYQRFLNILFWDVSVAQLAASVSGVVLGGVAGVVGSNLARGKLFTASIGSVDSLYPSVCIPRTRSQANIKRKIYSEILFPNNSLDYHITGHMRPT